MSKVSQEYQLNRYVELIAKETGGDQDSIKKELKRLFVTSSRKDKEEFDYWMKLLQKEVEEVERKEDEEPLKEAPWQARREFRRMRIDTFAGMAV